MSGVSEQRAGVKQALDRMKELTLAAKDALLTGRLQSLAAMLHEQFVEYKRTADNVSTAKIDEMYEESLRLGALGGKISSAGGGGFLLLYCPFDRKPAVSERLRAMGGEVYRSPSKTKACNPGPGTSRHHEVAVGRGG